MKKEDMTTLELAPLWHQPPRNEWSNGKFNYRSSPISRGGWVRNAPPDRGHLFFDLGLDLDTHLRTVDEKDSTRRVRRLRLRPKRTTAQGLLSRDWYKETQLDL